MTKFKNLEFPEFPSRFQIRNKHETRLKKFQELFDQLLNYAIKFPELKKRLLKMLYIFLIAECKTIEVSDESLNGNYDSSKPSQKFLINHISYSENTLCFN